MNPPMMASPSHAPAKSGLATASMILGILSPITCGVTSIPAVIMGHIALYRIKNSSGVLAGAVRAKWGLGLGYGGLVLMILVSIFAGCVAPMVIGQVDRETEVRYFRNARQIGLGLMDFHEEQGTDTAPYPSDLRQLESMGYVHDLDGLLTVGKKHAGDWLYFWAADAEDPEAVLLISPPLGKKPGDADANSILLTTSGAVRTVEPYVVHKALETTPEPPVKIPAPLKE